LAFRGELGARDTVRALDTGIVRTLWLTPDEIRSSAARHRIPAVLQCLDDYLRGAHFPLELVHCDNSVFGPTENTAGWLPLKS
jgi:hypothetical protein